MTQDFQHCLNFVLQAEGGFTDNPEDHGGGTDYGIIQTEYDAYREGHGLAVQSVRDITMEEVTDIYKAQYWQAVHADYVPMPLCLVLFDTAVNCGVGRAYEFLNQALGLGPARAWTSITSARFHTLNQAGIIATAERILALRHSFYEEIAQNPGQDQFLDGWLNRLTNLREAGGLVG